MQSSTQSLKRRSFLGRTLAALSAAIGFRSCETSPCPASVAFDFSKRPNVLRRGMIMARWHESDQWTPYRIGSYEQSWRVERGVLLQDCLPHEISDAVIDRERLTGHCITFIFSHPHEARTS